MCGIAGKLSLKGKLVTLQDIKLMTDAIEHRGPDDEGQWVEQAIGLGNRRLAVIDLSPKGHMPMFYDHNRYVITFNGEIYNFLSERKKLIKKGYRFRSNSDTEVVLALYQEYGTDCLRYLRGMFAFAIWDRREKILFAARDRLGKKPFKYYLDDQVFVFASELKAILTQKEVKTSPDFAAIYHYLSFQYVPHPMTGFTNIHKLPPAHYLLIKNGITSIHKYWTLNFHVRHDLSESEWEEQIIDKLNQSTKIRMISDVPLGAFLSGGTDSSAIVAMMSRNSRQPVKTFSIGFEEERFNELPYARQVADHYQTDHTELIVQPNAVEILPKLIYHYEEPFADSSAVPSYYVSQLARQDVTVVLNGDGGDENFAGYGWYPFYTLSESQLIYSTPRYIKKSFAYLSQQASHIFPGTLSARANRFANSLLEKNYQRYLRYLCYFTEEEKSNLIDKRFFQEFINQDSRDILHSRFASFTATDPLNKSLGVDIISYLPDDLLVKMDIATMANSLEARSPFLDHQFMELIAQMPPRFKHNGLTSKYILKKALRSYLPSSIMYRPKRGFAIPLENWIRHDLKELTGETLLNPSSFTSSFISQNKIKQLIIKQRHADSNLAPKIWALLTLELWFQRFFGR